MTRAASVTSRTFSAFLLLLWPHLRPNRVTFTRYQLLSAVLDKKDVPGTVDTYVHCLRKKIDRDVVETVRGVGCFGRFLGKTAGLLA